MRTAGSQFTVTVNGCDNYWNKRTDAAALVQLTATDLYYSTPTAAPLAGGAVQVQMTLVSAGTHTVTASDQNAQPLSPYTVRGVTVTPNVAWQLQVLVPGETNVGGKYNNGVITLEGRIEAGTVIDGPVTFADAAIEKAK